MPLRVGWGIDSPLALFGTKAYNYKTSWIVLIIILINMKHFQIIAL